MRTDRNICGVAEPARTKAPDAEATAQSPSGDQGQSPPGVAEVEPLGLLAFKECQNLFRTWLTGRLLRLIPQLTGLRLHVLWHRLSDFQEPGEMPILCPMVRRRTGAKGQWPKGCESCLQRRWPRSLFPAGQGRRFIGPCGITNFCACLRVDKVCPLTLVLQARVAPRSPSSHGDGQGGNALFWARHAGKPVAPAAFHDAVVLARLILHDLESTAQARMATSKLENALRRINETQTGAALLRWERRHRLPDLPESTMQPGSESHARKLVGAMVDYVHQHGHRPIGLDELAAAMKMNASYLSSLFSQTTGVTFHHFVEEVRLAKAKELLRDPRNRVGEAARAAGYASPDAFRHAFKAHEGLSPVAWRAGHQVGFPSP
jgi:AraC-like DNA-binding protein